MTVGIGYCGRYRRKEATVDVAEFDAWLSAIVALTPRQRQQAWQMLGLSEASEGDDIETGPPRG